MMATHVHVHMCLQANLLKSVNGMPACILYKYQFIRCFLNVNYMVCISDGLHKYMPTVHNRGICHERYQFLAIDHQLQIFNDNEFKQVKLV